MIIKLDFYRCISLIGGIRVYEKHTLIGLHKGKISFTNFQYKAEKLKIQAKQVIERKELQ